MRPTLDNSSSSSSSSTYQTSQYSGQQGSGTGRSNQQSDTDEKPTRMASRTPSTNPLHATYDDDEDNPSPEKSTADQQYEQAQRRLSTLKYAVNEFNHASHFDLAKAHDLFNKIKAGEEDLKLLAKQGSKEDFRNLDQFSSGMALCISNFAPFLSSGQPISPGLQHEGTHIPANSQLTTLEANDVRDMCNGLSTLFDDSLRSSLFSKSQIHRLTNQLREVNQALVVQAILKGLPSDLPSNGCLLDILNWQSRGLKSKLLVEDSKVIRALFARSLAIIEQWPAENGAPVTDAGKVVSRQLAKTLVQLNTIKSFNLIKLDKSPVGKANRERLGQCVLALCSEQALAELTLKRKLDTPDAKPLRVQPKGVEVSNISNTVKDFLEAGYLSLNNAKSYALAERITRLIVQIQQTDMQQRGGQTLGNCSNFLRTVQECAMRPQSSTSILQSTAYQDASNFLLKRIANVEFWEDINWEGKPDQTLANSASFLKAMVKWGKLDEKLLQFAILSLIKQIQHYGAEKITEAQSISGLLSALIAIAYLAPLAPVPAIIEQLLETVAQYGDGRWPAKSRAVALRAALAQQAIGDSLQALPAIDALLKAGVVHDDALPYLQAMLLRARDDDDRLKEFQPMLRQLLAEGANHPAAIMLEEIEEAIKRLVVREPVSHQHQSTKTEATPSSATEKFAIQAMPATPTQPAIPGLTNISAATTAPSSKPFTTPPLSSNVKPASRKRNADYSNEKWEEPANVLGNQKTHAQPKSSSSSEPVQASSNPVVKTRPPQTENSLPKRATDKNTIASKKTTSYQHDMPAIALPSVLNEKAKAAITRQWFESVRNTGLKNRMKVLEQLIEQIPELPEIQDGNGKTGRTALFHALILGDQALLGWLLPRMQPMSDIAVTFLLRLVFDEPALVNDAMKAAMKTLLGKLDASQREVIALMFNKHPEMIPLAYRDILHQFKPAEIIEKIIAPINVPTVRNDGKKIRRAQDIRRERESTDNYVLSERSYEEKRDDSLKFFLQKLERNINKAHPRNSILAAVFRGDLAAINALIDIPYAAAKISDPEKKSGMTPLFIAIIKKQNAIVARLLQTEAGILSATTPEVLGFTPLMRAVLENQTEIAHMLLALPNAIEQLTTQNFATLMNPLHHAVGKKDYKLARLLLNIPGAEAQALQLDTKGRNPLHNAIDLGDLNMMEILITMPNGMEQFNQLEEATQYQAFSMAVSKNKIEMVNFLLQHKNAEKLLTSSSDNGFNALSFAITNKFESIAGSIMISPYGEKVSLLAHFGDQIPLISAANAGLKRITSILLSMRTADQQAMCINDAGLTALMIAASKGHADIVRQLLAMPNAKDQARILHKTPSRIEIVDSTNTEKIRQHLNAELNAEYMKISISKQLGIPAESIDKYLNDLEKSTIGMNARQMAIKNGHTEIADLLLPFEES